MKSPKIYTRQELIDQSLAVEAAVRASVRQALIEHKRAGNPVVFCEGNNIRWVPAEEIEIPDGPLDGTD